MLKEIIRYLSKYHEIFSKNCKKFFVHFSNILQPYIKNYDFEHFEDRIKNNFSIIQKNVIHCFIIFLKEMQRRQNESQKNKLQEQKKVGDMEKKKKMELQHLQQQKADQERKKKLLGTYVVVVVQLISTYYVGIYTYSTVAKVLTRCFCLKQNYPDNRRYGRDRRWPNYL